MGSRGPLPKPPATRVRRNKPAPTTKVKADGRLRGPALPADLVDGDGKKLVWHKRTVAWWATWRRSPQARTFTATDWDFLLDTALMHHVMWAKGRWEFASEVRLRVARFGATPGDRARLGLDVDGSIGRSDNPTGSSKIPEGVTDIQARRARILEKEPGS